MFFYIFVVNGSDNVALIGKNEGKFDSIMKWVNNVKIK